MEGFRRLLGVLLLVTASLDKIEIIGLSHVKSLVDKVGGCPVVEDKDPSATWEMVFYKPRDSGLNAGNLLILDTVVEMKDTTRSKDSPWCKIAVPFKGKAESHRRKYLNAMVNFAKLFGASEGKAKKDMSGVVDFEIALAEAMVADYENDVVEPSYNFYSVNSLKSNFSGFPWDKFMKHFLPEDVRLTKTQIVMVANPGYVRRLIKLVEKTDKRWMVTRPLEKTWPTSVAERLLISVTGTGKFLCVNQRKLKTISNLYSNTHAPCQFRVNGALSNLRVFSEDLCPVGSKMNPVKKCTT